NRRAGRYLVLFRRAALVDDRIERRGHVSDALCGLDRLGDVRRQLRAVGFFLEELDAVLAFGGDEPLKIDVKRPTVVLAGLARESAATGGPDREAHHRLVDRSDLLDVERAIGQPLASAAFHCSVMRPSRMRSRLPSETAGTRGGLAESGRPSRNRN